MEIEEESEVNSNWSYEEWWESFEELYIDLEKLGFKSDSLKKKKSYILKMSLMIYNKSFNKLRGQRFLLKKKWGIEKEKLIVSLFSLKILLRTKNFLYHTF